MRGRHLIFAAVFKPGQYLVAIDCDIFLPIDTLLALSR